MRVARFVGSAARLGDWFGRAALAAGVVAMVSNSVGVNRAEGVLPTAPMVGPRAGARREWPRSVGPGRSAGAGEKKLSMAAYKRIQTPTTRGFCGAASPQPVRNMSVGDQNQHVVANDAISAFVQVRGTVPATTDDDQQTVESRRQLPLVLLIWPISAAQGPIGPPCVAVAWQELPPPSRRLPRGSCPRPLARGARRCSTWWWLMRGPWPVAR